MENNETPEIHENPVDESLGNKKQKNRFRINPKIGKPILWGVLLLLVIFVGKRIGEKVKISREEKKAQLVINKMLDTNPKLRVAENDVHFIFEHDATKTGWFNGGLKKGKRKIAFPVSTRIDWNVETKEIDLEYSQGKLKVWVPQPSYAIGTVNYEMKEAITDIGWWSTNLTQNYNMLNIN